MSAMASQNTSLVFVYSFVYSGADQRKHQSFASLAFVCGIHRWPVNSLHKGASIAENVYIWWRDHEKKPPQILTHPSLNYTLNRMQVNANIYSDTSNDT